MVKLASGVTKEFDYRSYCLGISKIPSFIIYIPVSRNNLNSVRDIA